MRGEGEKERGKEGGKKVGRSKSNTPGSGHTESPFQVDQTLANFLCKRLDTKHLGLYVLDRPCATTQFLLVAQIHPWRVQINEHGHVSIKLYLKEQASP
jgi:hypothetical protein